MRLCFVLLLLGLNLTVQAETEEKFHQSFQVKPGAALVVHVGFGSVQVSPQPTPEIVVDVFREVRFRNKSDEEKFLAYQPVTMTNNTGVVEVLALPIKPETFWQKLGTRRTEATYTIGVPVDCKVDLHTSGGNISVQGVGAPVRARTSGGGLNFANLHGKLDGKTSGGNVEAIGCQGELDLHTSGGMVNVRTGSGSLEAASSGGSLHVTGFEGPLTLRTSGGSIEISGAKGSIEAKTSGGSIRAALKALNGPVDLATSGGNVQLDLPSNAAANLDARASAGHVQSELPVVAQGEARHGHLAGAINGGGPEVHLRTSAGNIDIKKMRPLPSDIP